MAPCDDAPCISAAICISAVHWGHEQSDGERAGNPLLIILSQEAKLKSILNDGKFGIITAQRDGFLRLSSGCFCSPCAGLSETLWQISTHWSMDVQVNNSPQCILGWYEPPPSDVSREILLDYKEFARSYRWGLLQLPAEKKLLIFYCWLKNIC